MQKRTINPWTWQEQRGFDQAIEISRFDRLLFCSGQSSVDADGNVQHAGDMRGQVELVIKNIQTVLTAAGYSWQDIVEMKWYTTDLEELSASSDVFESLLGAEQIRAAQSVYVVSEFAMPGLMLEIEVTAAK
ncbi:MAG: RidA family protein [Sphaerobacteraceae bacterium]|nr:MAG: RidA family protein [Sphaerobacteraceae bacterium]